MEEDFIGLIDSYLENTPTLLNGIEAGVANQNCSQVAVSSHSLKSSSANVGAMKLSELSKRLELAARADEFSQVQELAAEVVAQYQKVEQALKAICERGTV
ncbi:MAG: Hpt domain-containing protein [Chromatiales bacterium]|nr:Hpt domain-containing protein [Chromatiales bacterium]